MAIIYTYPTKQNPQTNDLVLISDTSDGNKTKNATISSLQSSVAGVGSINTMTGQVILDAGSNLSVTETPSSNTITYSLNPDVVISSTLSIPDGTSATPSLLFSNEPGTGVYRTSSGGFGVACSTVPALEVTDESVNVPTKIKVEEKGTASDQAIEIRGKVGMYSTENDHPSTSYTVTVEQDNDGNNVFALDDGNGPVQRPVLDLTNGETYTFDWSAADASNHPFLLVQASTRDPNTAALGSPFTTGVTVNGTTTEIVVGNSGGSRIYYVCETHGAGMGNLINLHNAHNVSLSTDGSHIATMDGRNNSISGITTLTGGVRFSTNYLNPDADVLNSYEEGRWMPWLEYCIYDFSYVNDDGSIGRNFWYPWGGSEDYNAYDYVNLGYYTKIGNTLQLNFVIYPRNKSNERFVCNGLRVKLPYDCKSGALARGFNGSITIAAANNNGYYGGWVSGSYMYLLVDEVGLSERVNDPYEYINKVNGGLNNVYADNTQITVSPNVSSGGLAGTTTSAYDDKFRYPSTYFSTYGKNVRASLRDSNYSVFGFSGTANVNKNITY